MDCPGSQHIGSVNLCLQLESQVERSLVRLSLYSVGFDANPREIGLDLNHRTRGFQLQILLLQGKPHTPGVIALRVRVHRYIQSFRRIRDNFT